MKSSPVAPSPVAMDSKKPSASNTGSSSTSQFSKRIASDSVSPRRNKTTQPRHLKTAEQFSKSPYQSNGNNYELYSFDSDYPALASSSMSMEEDNSGNSNPKADDGNDCDVPLVGRECTDDIDHASTDDPYTYSDDSASLSDAYFLQQPPRVSSNLNGVYSGLLPLASSKKEHGDLSSKDETIWRGPHYIHSDDNLFPNNGVWKRDHQNARSVGNRSSKRHVERDQRLNRRQPQQEQEISSSSSTIEEEVINENTSLLDGNTKRKLRPRDTENIKEQKRNTSRTKNSDRPVATSYAHRQHRKKHQLRKHERNLLLQKQQKRQEERERAVSEIRGQPQSRTMRRDRFWLVLFTLQLLFVCTYAFKYGLTLYHPLASSEIESVSTTNVSNETDSIEIYSLQASSMLVTSVENEVPTVQSGTIDDPLSAPGLIDEDENDSDLDAIVQDKPFTIDYKNVLSLLLISGMYACVISYLSFAFMLILARSIIPIMLVFTILFLLCFGVFGSTIDSHAGSIISIGGFTMFGMSVAYTMTNWNQIPFWSTNFHTAICAMRSSIGILLVGISSLFVGLLWLLIWTIALMGTFNRINSTDCEMWDECETHVYIYRGRIIEIGLLLISLYWTTAVIKNIARVAVAGAIGGPWWFATIRNYTEEGRPQRPDRCCGRKSIVYDPLIRACTNSLGTICLGSLVEFPAQLFSKIVSFFCWLTGSNGDDLNLSLVSEQSTLVTRKSTMSRLDSDNNEDEENSENSCTRTEVNTSGSEITVLPSQSQAPTTAETCFEALKMHLRHLDHILQSCNRWSYIYVGIYNYSFYEGGKKAIQLFETREWMVIARDTLIQNILLMASIVIGGWSGMLAVLVEEVDGYEFTSLHKPIMTSFLIGFFLGFVLSNILLLGLAAPAVDTVLVCFAAEPFAFDRHHPHLSREMREVWSQQVWEPDASNG